MSSPRPVSVALFRAVRDGVHRVLFLSAARPCTLFGERLFVLLLLCFTLSHAPVPVLPPILLVVYQLGSTRKPSLMPPEPALYFEGFKPLLGPPPKVAFAVISCGTRPSGNRSTCDG
mmetsp:Transcript_27599/g.84034  ORF Transcript_27599/g.84034 Transcript_27599/m.84034 type:complete len:117 (-) Transcript_27599:425-775(-)